MSLLILMLLLGVLSFGFVVFFGAPYLPTMTKQQETALDLLDLKKGQTLLELGSGDGRILKAAAKRGIKAVGYEINPLLVVYCKLYLWRYRKLVSVKFANYWSIKLPQCDGMYVFLLDKYMARLSKKITQEISTSVKVVSFAFKFPNDKHVSESNGLYLYIFDNKKLK